MKIHNTDQNDINIDVPAGYPLINVSEFQLSKQISDKMDPARLELVLKLAVKDAIRHFTADDFVFPEDDASEILFQQGVYAYGFMHLQSFLPVHQQIKSDPVEPAEIRKQEKSWRSVGLSFFMQIEGFDTETQPTTIFSAVV